MFQVPSLDGELTPQAAHVRPPLAANSSHLPEAEETEEEVTLRNSPSPPRSDGAARNWINQPKLIPADSETVPPCPEKRPLTENSVRPRSHAREDRVRETTPLLPPPPQSSRQDRDCCVLI